MLRHDQETTRRFLDLLMAPDPDLPACTELRVFAAQFGRAGFVEPAPRYSSTLASWYTEPNALALDAARLAGVSGFVTFNPVSVELLKRSMNGLAKQRHTTTDADVLRLRWLYMDIDPVRPSDISSTDEELAAAVDRRDAILGDYPQIARASMWGKSGNGCWILLRLPDLANDAAGNAAVARLLAAISAKYTDKTVKVDLAPKNASRVMCLPGTPKCKGRGDDPERPHRLATLDHPSKPEAAPAVLELTHDT